MLAAQTVEGAGAAGHADFVSLVEPLLPAAYRLAVAMLRSETDAEDAVQEAVFNAWRHRAGFRAGAEMKPWLLAIVANECRSVRRSRWWSVIKRPSVEAGRELHHDPSTAALRLAIQKLPHDQRLAVVLRYYLDLSFDEVARVLKTTPKGARSRTYRALERLRLDPEVISDE